MDIRDSSTFWAIFDEGRIEEAQRSILRLGRQKFGSPNDALVAAIMAITVLEHLHRMAAQLLTVSTWDELLATP